MTKTFNIDDYSALYCCITYELMTEPFIVSCCSQTFEKNSILKCINDTHKCPLCRKSIDESNISPNRAIKDIINNIKSQGINIPQKIEKNIISSSFNDISTFNKNNNQEPLIVDSSYCNKDDFIQGNIKINYSKIIDINDIPQSIVLLIDVSGSTNIEVTAKNEDGSKLENGFNILDLIKHCLNTLIKTFLNKNIKVSVITFSNLSTVITKFDFINDINISNVISNINAMISNGGTYMWESINYTYEHIKKTYDKERNYSIMLFTDGCPSHEPPRGFLFSLKKLQQDTDLCIPIHTYGFGTNLLDGLLSGLSTVSGGSNSFIADGSTMGTIMVHTCALIRNLICNNININIYTNEDLIYNKNIGFIQSDIERSFIFELPKLQINKNTKIEIIYDFLGNSYKSEYPLEFSLLLSSVKFDDDFYSQIIEKYVIDFLNESIIKRKRGIIPDFTTIFNILDSKQGNKFIDNIIDTFQEQFILAFNNEYFNTWGKHYIYALLNALTLQIKTNFKDKILDNYGDSQIFIQFINEGEIIFADMPPPIPSIVTTSSRNGIARTFTTPSNMRDYNNAGAPCFHENCVIAIIRNSKFVNIKLKDLNEDDLVFYEKNKLSTIKCIVQTECLNNEHEFIKLGKGLLITPYHPIYIPISNKWEFPININKNICVNKCKYIYSIALDNENANSVFINGIECISLGHNIIDDDIAKHPFFGSQEIIEKLKLMDGFDQKRVILPPNPLLRNTKTQLIDSFIHCNI